MIQVKPSTDGQFFVVVTGNNNKILLQSEMYTRKRNAMRAAQTIKDLFHKKIVVIKDKTI